MYCPKCSLPLVVDDKGIWRCTSGGLELSERFGKALSARYAAASRLGRPTVNRIHSEHFFCPSCAAALSADSVCPECRESFREFVWQLIELHSHADGKGGWK